MSVTLLPSCSEFTESNHQPLSGKGWSPHKTFLPSPNAAGIASPAFSVIRGSMAFGNAHHIPPVRVDEPRVPGMLTGHAPTANQSKISPLRPSWLDRPYVPERLPGVQSLLGAQIITPPATAAAAPSAGYSNFGSHFTTLRPPPSPQGGGLSTPDHMVSSLPAFSKAHESYFSSTSGVAPARTPVSHHAEPHSRWPSYDKQAETLSPRSTISAVSRSSGPPEAILEGSATSHSRAQLSLSAQADVRRRSVSEYSTSDRSSRGALQSSHSQHRPTSSASSQAASTTPLCLGQREILGKGMCHVYSDGSHTKAIIEGEAVNPDWGVTKAGKPRKRLAQACLNCREKKIKCEPGSPSCSQCAKLGRECRRSLNRTSPELVSNGDRPASSQGEVTDREMSSDVTVTKSEGHTGKKHSLDLSAGRGVSSQTKSPKNVEAYEHNTERWYKRLRSSPGPSTSSLTVGADAHTNSSFTHSNRIGPAPLPQSHRFSVHTDPYVANRDLTMHLMNLSFANRDNASVCTVLPQQSFQHWVQTCTKKSDDDIAMLYALLAVGTLYDHEAGLKARELGHYLAGLARDTIKALSGKYNLQLVQTRLFLSLWDAANGLEDDSWENTSAAFTALNALNWCTEVGITDIVRNPSEYGFQDHESFECRRRTFWLYHILNCSNSVRSARMPLVRDRDIFIRLPNTEDDYLARAPAVGPLFNGGNVDWSSAFTKEQGSMALLVELVAIRNAVFAYSYRTMNESTAESSQQYEAFYSYIQSSLADWRERLAPHLQLTTANTRKAVEHNRFNTYFTIHTLHLAINIELVRYVSMEALPAEIIRRNICQAFQAARSMASMAKILCTNYLDVRTADVNATLSQPVVADCLLAACDVICSGGLLECLGSASSALSSVKRLVDEIAKTWHGAKRQSEKFNEALRGLSARYLSSGDKLHWRMESPLHASFVPRHRDLVRTAPDDLFFEAISELPPMNLVVER